MVKHFLSKEQRIFRVCDVCETRPATRELPCDREVADGIVTIYSGGTKGYCSTCFKERADKMREQRPQVRIVEPNELVMTYNTVDYCSIKDNADLLEAQRLMLEDSGYGVYDRTHYLTHTEISLVKINE